MFLFTRLLVLKRIMHSNNLIILEGTFHHPANKKGCEDVK